MIAPPTESRYTHLHLAGEVICRHQSKAKTPNLAVGVAHRSFASTACALARTGKHRQATMRLAVFYLPAAYCNTLGGGRKLETSLQMVCTQFTVWCSIIRLELMSYLAIAYSREMI